MDSGKADPADEKPDPYNPASFFAQMVAPWTAMGGMWSAWYEASKSLWRERGVDVARSFEQISTPGGKLGSLLAELQNVLRLPKFADLPDLDLSFLHSSAAFMDLAGLLQQYISLSVPIWAEASRRFQKEMAERAKQSERAQSPGEALDVWNGVFDRTLMEFNRSGEFIRMHRRLLRASMQHRIELRKLGERSAWFFDMPTRKEMSDLYQRMHDMQREMYKLRQEVRLLRRHGLAVNGQTP